MDLCQTVRKQCQLIVVWVIEMKWVVEDGPGIE